MGGIWQPRVCLTKFVNCNHVSIGYATENIVKSLKIFSLVPAVFWHSVKNIYNAVAMNVYCRELT